MPSGCHDLAKWLSYYLYFFSFLFLFGLTIQERKCGKVSYDNIIHHNYISEYHRVTLYNECGKVVHRPYSSCISSI